MDNNFENVNEQITKEETSIPVEGNVQTQPVQDPPKKNKKKIIIIISIIVILLLIGGVVVFLAMNNKKNTKQDDNNINAIKRSGKEMLIYKFISTDEEEVSEYFGIEQPSYLKGEVTQEEIGKITCATNSCSFTDAAIDYVLVKENGSYSLFNYKEDKLIANGLGKQDGYETEIAFLSSSKEKTFGAVFIYSSKEDKDYFQMYSIGLNKTSELFEGNGYCNDSMNGCVYKNKDGWFEPGYIKIVSNENDNGKHYIYNFNTGKVFAVEGQSIAAYSVDDNLFFAVLGNPNDKIYDINGNVILDNVLVRDVTISSDKLAVLIDGVDYETNKLIIFNKNSIKDQEIEFTEAVALFDGYVITSLSPGGDTYLYDWSGKELDTLFERSTLSIFEFKFLRSTFFPAMSTNEKGEKIIEIALIASDRQSENQVIKDSEYPEETEAGCSNFYGCGYIVEYNVNTKQKKITASGHIR